jgi:two-component sensor histidine kinase
MPSSSWFPHQRVYAGIRRFRRYPALTYGLAVVLVGIAMAFRLSTVGSHLLPFVTFYPAIIISTLVGGIAVGIFAAAFSAVLAWYLILPVYEAWTLSYGGLTINLDAQVAQTAFIILCVVLLSFLGFLDRTLRRVLEQERTLSILVENVTNGLLVFDKAGTIRLVNQGAETLFGYKGEELIGKPVEMLAPGGITGPELVARRKDGSEVPVEILLSPVASRSGEATLAMVIDISARKRLQASQQLVISELQHRTRNLFAVVTAIAMNTFSARRSLGEARSVFTSRMQALQKAHDLLENTSWEGVTLADILERQFAGMRDRVDIAGCEIPIRISAAQQFTLILNELTANALKHGALSQDEGRIRIQGTVDRSESARPTFCFDWEESGGPVVVPPASIGFGTLMVDDAARRFAREVKSEFAARGLRYELRIDLEEIFAEDTADSSAPGA